jgi:hypothetical protein
MHVKLLVTLVSCGSLITCYLHQDPIKSIHFSSSNPLCHAFDPEAKDGHDLLVGVFSGDGMSNAS